ncbi:MAG: hypothetical protein DRR08_31670, partial [Candidatus Parabeggiatoa sp. nov. 2]
ALLTKIDRQTPRIQVGAFMKFHFNNFDKFPPNGPCQTALALRKKSHRKIWALPNGHRTYAFCTYADKTKLTEY